MIATGLLLIGRWGVGTQAVWLIGALVAQGFGLGLFQVAITDIVVAAIPREQRGVAGRLVMVTRTVGTVAAAAVVMLLFQNLEARVGFFVAVSRHFPGRRRAGLGSGRAARGARPSSTGWGL